MAASRTYNTDDLSLDAIELTPGGPLEADNQLRVTAVQDGGSTPQATSTAGR